MMTGFSAMMPAFAPITAEFVSDESPTTYGTGCIIGKMMSVSVSPNFTQLPRLAKFANFFENASVALNTTFLPVSAYETMFGDYGAEEQGIPGGFGYIEGVINNGSVSYRMSWIRRVVFTPPPESAVSISGNTVSFTTPSLTGIAWDDGSGKWKDDPQIYSTAAAAIAALKAKAGIS